MKPKISILLCTFNAPELVRTCLDSILRQDFKNFEVICIDGMSKDNTLDVVKEYSKKDKRIRFIINKKGLPEGKGYGKWQGYQEAKGEIIGIIDQDNILQRNDLFSQAISAFSQSQNLAGVLGGLTHNVDDKSVVRYVSLVGTDSFFAYRSLDFVRNLGNKTKQLFSLSKDNMLLTGGNCFFYKKKDLDSIGGYTQDVLIINNLISKGKNFVAVIPNSTKHYAEKDLFSLIKKKFFWGKKYSAGKEPREQFNYLPSSSLERNAFLKNLAFCFLVIPNFIYSINILQKSKDPVILLFPIMAFFNALGYGLNFFKQKL